MVLFIINVRVADKVLDEPHVPQLGCSKSIFDQSFTTVFTTFLQVHFFLTRFKRNVHKQFENLQFNFYMTKRKIETTEQNVQN